MSFVRFGGSATGHALRVVAGLALIVAASPAGGTAGWTADAVGLIALSTGLANLCLFTPRFHTPLRGPTHAASWVAPDMGDQRLWPESLTDATL